MNKNISQLSLESLGIRKEDHPTCFKTITITLNIQSQNITEIDLKKVLALSESSYCPVWAMLKGNVEIIVLHNIFVWRKIMELFCVDNIQIPWKTRKNKYSLISHSH
jgi:hypothetical protein